MNKLFLSAIFSAAITLSSVVVSEAKTILVYGEGHSFTVDEPKGWIMDYKSGVDSGFPVVSYPENTNWDDARSVVYIKLLDKEKEGSETLSSLIEEDLRNLKDFSTSTKMTKQDALMTKDLRDAIIRKYTDGQGINHATAYIVHPQLVVMATLSADSEAKFDENYDIFQQIVESYNFKTSRVDDSMIKRLQEETYPDQKQ